MKRTLTLAALMLLGTLLAITLTVNLLAVAPDPAARPDPLLPIDLPDGSQRPLGELLSAWRELHPPQEPAASEGAPEVSVAQDPPQHAPSTAEDISRVLEQLRQAIDPAHIPDDLFDLAEWHRHQGNTEQATALYLSLPKDHPRWARAQRRLAWDCYTQAQGTPERGVAYAHAALTAEPFDGNSWQDLARVYAAALGVPVD